jgi:hypothetical protein
MRSGFVASVALTIAVLGCSTPEAPPAPAAPAPTAMAKPQPSPAPPKEGATNRPPGTGLPTIALPQPEGVPDPRRAETPCDRHEPGWKWVGSVVDEGRCVVGPCNCVQG